MWKAFVAGVVLAWAWGPSVAADLSPTEMRWLRGGWPVVAYAQAAGMPLDIVVQPQPAGAAAAGAGVHRRPLQAGAVDAGNPDAEATLARIEPELLGPTLELMTAHELATAAATSTGPGGVPAGFAHSEPAGLSDEQREAWEDMSARGAREGYGDLVGLAWTAEHHPQQYARLHAGSSPSAPRPGARQPARHAGLGAAGGGPRVWRPVALRPGAAWRAGRRRRLTRPTLQAVASPPT